jgi:hypothetical protein
MKEPCCHQLQLVLQHFLNIEQTHPLLIQGRLNRHQHKKQHSFAVVELVIVVAYS